jgi:predicted transcriptional regulator
MKTNPSNRKLLNITVISRFLRKQAYPAQIAKKLGVSRAAISQFLKKMVSQGLIRQTNKYPAFYQIVEKNDVKQPENQPLEWYSDVKQDVKQRVVSKTATDNDSRRLFEPHRWGVWFRVKEGRLGGVFGGRFREWLRREDGFSIRCFDGKGGQKVLFWLKKFKGVRARDVLKESEKMLFERVGLFARQHGVVLEFWKSACDKEWATTVIEGELTKWLLENLELKDSPKRLGWGIVFTDKSHLGKVEVKTAIKGKEGATDLVKRMDWVAYGDAQKEVAELRRVLSEMARQQVEFSKSVSETLAVMKKIEPLKPEDRLDVA